jgi:hypothetical protein
MSKQIFSTIALLKMVLDIEERYPNHHQDKYFNLNQLEDDLDDYQLLNDKQRHILWLKYEQNEENCAIAKKFNITIENYNDEIETILLILHYMSPNYRERKQTVSISQTIYSRI